MKEEKEKGREKERGRRRREGGSEFVDLFVCLLIVCCLLFFFVFCLVGCSFLT